MVIYNPVAGQRAGREVLQAACATLTRQGWTLDIRETDGPGAATRLAREAVEGGDEVVVVAGGDGTINETIQALAGTETALAVLPVGTVNVWAREIGLPAHSVQAANALAHGACRLVDLGRVGDRYFLLMAGAGFDGAVTGLVEPRLKRAMGRWAYVAMALRLALRYGGPEATVEMDNGTVRCRLLLAVVGNTRLYAGRFTITASAIADDGQLDVVLFPGRHLWQALPRLIGLLARRHPAEVGALYYRTTQVRITTAGPLPIQADGDYIAATTPLEIEVVPSALHVIVPRSAGEHLFSKPAHVPAGIRNTDEES